MLILLGLTPSRSYLEIDPDLVRVRMSWGFRADIPRRSIRSLRRLGSTINIGVHGWRGRWLVNGAAGPLVALAVEPPSRARALGFPIRLRELIVSVDDPDAVVAELSGVRAGAE